jgi:sigma-B regulation protein RsbU (phosphoserine phosphatase)
MQQSDRVTFLAATELLARVPRPGLEAIARDMLIRQVDTGVVLFEEGDPGDEAYLVVDGDVALVAGGVEIACRGAGGMVGEFALIDAGPRSTTAVARTPLTLLSWPRSAFLGALAADSAVALGILRALTAKLRGEVDQSVDLMLDRLRWNQDLERSREIQMGMLPDRPLSTEWVEVAGHCAPAGAVGGDFYDVLPFAGGDVGVIVLDVTGHGFYSGLFVAMAKSGLHAQARVDHRPEEVMAAMRRTLSLSLERHMLMSCAYALAEPRRAMLRYANAGHPHPLIYRHATRAIETLEVIDPILGVDEVDATAYGCLEVPWHAGDLLVLYSDGITEARDPDDRLFGTQRLRCVLARTMAEDPDRSAAAVCETLLETVCAHTGAMPADDDVTLVVMRALTSANRGR